jgi:hypothetical protein
MGIKSAAAPILFAVSLFAGRALGCSCVEPPPPCQAVGQTQLVFLGTVTQVNAEPGAFKTAQMHVDRLYRGQIKETIELFDDGMCDGPLLEAGRQYLMYTSELPTGAIPARGCTRSRAVEAADADLDFLKEYSAGAVRTHISGIVRYRPDEPEDSKLGDEGRTPMKDVRVTVSSGGKEFSTDTNSLGQYFFTGLPAGQYEIDAQSSGYRLNWAPNNLTLRANGCLEANMLMKVDRRVYGVVRDANGAPASGVIVEMMSVNRQLKRWEQPVLLGISDPNGKYVIDGVPPGNYYLGINIKSTPTKQHPYSSTYYPNTADIGQALQIGFALGASVRELNLRIPNRLPLVTIQGRVVNPDGTSPRVEDHPQIRIKEPGLFGQIEEESIEIDAEGRFQFELCEGVSYSAFAFSGPIRNQTYSAPVEFRPTQEDNRLVLILGKSSAEFEKLRRR